jgi:beta-lactam-binding protein with PASTA domain
VVETPSDKTAGQVIDQEPRPGEKITDSLGTVKLYVAVAPTDGSQPNAPSDSGQGGNGQDTGNPPPSDQPTP